MTRLLLMLSLAFLAVACGTFRETQRPTPHSGDAQVKTYVVINIDGPPVDVLVNGARVAHLMCGMGSVDLLAAPGVPPLPWRLQLIRADASVMYQGEVANVSESRKVLIRGDAAGEMPWHMSAGPAPKSPCFP